MELRRSVRQGGRAVVSRLARWGDDATADASGVDLMVAAVLPQVDVLSLADPAAFVRNLRESWCHHQTTLVELRDAAAPTTTLERRFDTLLDVASTGLPPLSAADAVRLATAADRLAADRRPFDRPGYATDVAEHATRSSSAPRIGRLLAALVRFLRAEQVLEVGTAYGISSLFLELELPPGGQVVTLEISEPQLTVSAELLAGSGRVQRWSSPPEEAAPRLASEMPRVDLLFHDGAHSRDAYIADFEALLPLLPPGGVVLLDDIRWQDAHDTADSGTYEGWLHIAHSPRVRRALELENGSYGLVQLS